MVWKYRGQVTPRNELITTVIEITEVGIDEVGPFVIGAGSLWVDGLRIYEVSNMGMRLVPCLSRVTEHAIDVDLVNHPQLIDHAVNGVPVVPVAFVIDWFARLVAAHRPDLHLVELVDLRVLSGLVATEYFRGGSLHVVAAVVESEVNDDGVLLSLRLTDAATGRLHYRCSAQMSPTLPSAGTREHSAVADGEQWTSEIYRDDVLFHGPAFHVIEEITDVSDLGLTASCWGVFAVGWRTEPWASDPAVLDGAMQLALLWTRRQLGLSSLPTAIGTVRIFSAPTFGQHTMSLVGRRTSSHMVVCDVEIRSAAGDVVAQLDGIETHVLSQPTDLSAD